MALGPTSMLRGVQSTQLRWSRPEARTDAPMAVLYVPAAARDRAVVRERLARAGATVSVAADVPDAVQMLGARRYGLVVVDLAGERTALATIRLLRAQFPTVPIVGVMDPAQPVVAGEAIYAGVNDVLPWPVEERDVAAVMASARDHMAIEPGVSHADAADRLFMHSAAMRLVADAMRAASARKTGVLLCGEPGTGRALIARALHAMDDEYVNRPFVHIDCSGDAGHDLERQVFGAIDRQPETIRSGAEHIARASALVAAQGGSLFLTNVIDAPARVQAKLARVLRDREVFSVDANEVIRLDVRVMGSVGPDVDGAVSDGRLRRDLFERLAQVRIDVPPLHRRREDMPFLASLFLRRACEAERVGQKRFSRAALALLSALPWRRNAAELRDVVTAVVRGTRHTVVQLDDVLEHATFDGASAPADAGLTLREARARFERECISSALLRHHGRVGDAAKALGIQRTNLYRKVRQLKVSRSLLSSAK